jgi:hypothetical protein
MRGMHTRKVQSNRQSYKQKSKPSDERLSYKRLELVHSDIAGPLPPSHRNMKYVITYTEDHSNFTIIDGCIAKHPRIHGTH